MYFIGLDIGSSSVKAALVRKDNGICIHKVQKPDTEMEIHSKNPNWAEQDPELWWKYCCHAIQELLKVTAISSSEIIGIGISYQMHGLVLIDREGKLIRPAILWCDSRAVSTGQQIEAEIDGHILQSHLLNAPSNFTFSKLKWVKDQEPETFKKVYKFMLPGDYIAYKLTGKVTTTGSGLSEGIVWDFKNHQLATFLFERYDMDTSIVPNWVDTFAVQGKVHRQGAEQSHLPEGTPILYRAGDQPNNALSLGVFNPGEIAATAGTSGVVYAVSERLEAKEMLRINSFAHVNHTKNTPRIGKLLNINGAGIHYRWLKEVTQQKSYEAMNTLALEVAIGSNGLCILPFGNGAERIFNNKTIGGQILGLNFNIHQQKHICRAALEGISFSFAYGMEILKEDGVAITTIKVGNDNLFRSEIFARTLASVAQCNIEVYNTTGAIGAARACILHEKDWKYFSAMLSENDRVKTYTPDRNSSKYAESYTRWKHQLIKFLK